MTTELLLPNLKIPAEVQQILDACPKYTLADSIDDLVSIATMGKTDTVHEVAYDVPGKGRVLEATVAQVRNGVAANYPEPYMRRRDPDCMVIGDNLPTNKPRFEDRFKRPFEELRQETFAWLKTQELLVLPFIAGNTGAGGGMHAIAICPANAGFFAFGLALLQGMIPAPQLNGTFEPKAVIYVAPPFRHTHFGGKQMVVHNRRRESGTSLHELFSFNLYPGPSAKKGVYGMLLNLGEQEGWVTAHCSTVQVVTPYDNVVTFMHEGASGGGKSEMLEHIHREADGRLLLGVNTITGDKRHLTLARGCELHPVTDDMALCHPTLQGNDKKLALMDAETAWFVRVNHITQYGIDPNLEALTLKPKEPLLFLSIDAVPGSRAIIWDHIEDAPGKACPNPRVVVPRRIVPNVVNEAVTVDIRSFGVRMPPCTKERPTYGISGLLHILPPALAWLWRLVAPRGHDNPSIVNTEAMSSEGVGSYWPFATGRRVDQANLLLQQILDTTRVRYIFCPNQHVGAWKVSFMPQWLAREYLARRGNAKFKADQLDIARCPLLGYVPKVLNVEGASIPPWMLRVELQPEVGVEAYDAGAEILYAFFRQQLAKFRSEGDLLPLGQKIIDACLANATVEEYAELIRAE